MVHTAPPFMQGRCRGRDVQDDAADIGGVSHGATRATAASKSA
jgi:hypothetical protein